MAWNGSNREEVKKAPASSPSPKFNRGIIAGLVVVLGGAIAAWVMIGGGESQVADNKDARPSQIAEVKPQIVTNAPEVVREKTAAEKAEEYWKDKMYVDEKGVKRYPGGMRWLDPNREVRQQKRPISRMGRLFKHPSERAIAGLLTVEPGATMFGTVYYRPELKEDFLASLDEPIEEAEDDTEEDRALKQAVAETKKDLKARIDAGEDLVKILSDTREELQRMGAYRNDLKKQLAEFNSNESYSDEDIKDLTKAANMMLENEGLPPLKSPSVFARQVMLSRMKEKEKKKQ